MLVIDRVPRVVVKLEPGVYEFSRLSATGKTYLTSILKEYALYGEKVRGFSYEDILAGHKPSELAGCGAELIVFDRYDLYYREEIDSVLKSNPQAVMLFDSKKGATPSVPGKQVKYADVDFGFLELVVE